MPSALRLLKVASEQLRHSSVQSLLAWDRAMLLGQLDCIYAGVSMPAVLLTNLHRSGCVDHWVHHGHFYIWSVRMLASKSAVLRSTSAYSHVPC